MKNFFINKLNSIVGIANRMIKFSLTNFHLTAFISLFVLSLLLLVLPFLRISFGIYIHILFLPLSWKLLSFYSYFKTVKIALWIYTTTIILLDANNHPRYSAFTLKIAPVGIFMLGAWKYLAVYTDTAIYNVNLMMVFRIIHFVFKDGLDWDWFVSKIIFICNGFLQFKLCRTENRFLSVNISFPTLKFLWSLWLNIFYKRTSFGV